MQSWHLKAMYIKNITFRLLLEDLSAHIALRWFNFVFERWKGVFLKFFRHLPELPYIIVNPHSLLTHLLGNSVCIVLPRLPHLFVLELGQVRKVPCLHLDTYYIIKMLSYTFIKAIFTLILITFLWMNKYHYCDCLFISCVNLVIYQV